ncbi:MAG: diphthine--ammonia ligase [Candidatus Omnitrophota bacterium]
MSDLTAACSWSSGKDSCLALYRAVRSGFKIKYLVNFISREYQRVAFHGAPAELVDFQSQALGIPLLQRETTKDNYEAVFRKTLSELKGMGINQLVRGDIFLLDLRDWVEDVCASEGIKVISPIWGYPAEEIIREFVNSGFRSILTSSQAEKLDESWVGRTIDEEFIENLKSVPNVDLCGENGEFHTFVYDGPIFRKRIDITKTSKVLINGYWFLDIQEYKTIKKGDME